MSTSKKKIYPKLDVLPYGRQSIDEDDIKSVVATLKSPMLTQGPAVSLFEEELCKTLGAKFAAALCNGTAALHVACLAAGVKEGDEVVTSTNSFVASANCAFYCGATPVLADIDPKTYNVTAETLKAKITRKTKAVIPVHFAGRSCEMDKIREMVLRKEKEFGHKIYIIEDASHALGSSYQGKMTGSCAYSDMTTLSFHPVKHITTAEGGAVMTNDKDLIKKLRLLRSHGIEREASLMDPERAFENKEPSPWYYEQQTLGYNYRISDIQCALGISQMKKLKAFCRQRTKVVCLYDKAFKDIEGVTIPSFDAHANYHLYVLLVDFKEFGLTRTRFMLELKKKKVLTQVHYIPIHTHPFYQKTLKTSWGDCPNAEKYYKQCVSLPLYQSLEAGEVKHVIKAVKEVLSVN